MLKDHSAKLEKEEIDEKLEITSQMSDPDTWEYAYFPRKNPKKYDYTYLVTLINLVVRTLPIQYELQLYSHILFFFVVLVEKNALYIRDLEYLYKHIVHC